MRRAFTLVELLVAIAIIVALAALALVFLPKREVRLAADGAAQLQTYIASAKSRALRDGAPRGVRLISTDGGASCREVQYIEVPENYGPLPGVGLVMAGVQSGNAATYVAKFQGAQGADLTGAVAYGDLLDTTDEGTTHRVFPQFLNSTTIPPQLNGLPNPQYDPVTNTTYVQLASAPKAAVGGRYVTPTAYRFVRQPRPLLGEPTLQLPASVLIDGAFSLNLPRSYDQQNVDILFAPSGQVINAIGGRVVLWVRDDNNVSAPTLVAIYSHTGGVAAHPISTPWNPSQPVGPGNNPYAFTQDGKSSGQ